MPMTMPNFSYQVVLLRTPKAHFYRTLMLSALTGVSICCYSQGVSLTAKVLVPDSLKAGIGIQFFEPPTTASSVSWVATTGLGVVFSVQHQDSTPFILEVTGQQGVGRAYVNPLDVIDTIRITYPVIEKVIILHTNDRHFHTNRIHELEAAAYRYRVAHPDVLLVDAGDVFVRSARRWVLDGKPMPDTLWYGQRASQMIETMNQLGYHALTLGNHELYYVGTHTGYALQKAQFPLLAANVEVTSTVLPSPQPYTIFTTTTARRVAFVGITYLAEARPGITVGDPLAAVDRHMVLRGQSDILIALTHLGYGADLLLAQLYPQLDAIIGGHTHDLLNPARFENGVLIAQAGGNQHEVSSTSPLFLGVVTITLRNGTVATKEGYVITLGE